MAITPVQVGALVDRMQIVGSLFQPLTQLLGVCQSPGEGIVQKQLARHAMKNIAAGLATLLAEPISDPTLEPYTAAQVEGISEGLSTFMACQQRILRDIGLAQQDLLLDENGNVVVGFSAAQKTAMENEIKRLYGKMKALLEAMP